MGSPAQNLAPAWERIGRLQHANQVNNADSILGAAGSAADVRASASILDTLHAIGELSKGRGFCKEKGFRTKQLGRPFTGLSMHSNCPTWHLYICTVCSREARWWLVLRSSAATSA
ncbi:hypothetical protein CVIRNUC_006101 [Coccomyxa viridis]|uniref:Uncharacterized protein n=1 Tax=Coccomyxa viridis TaxID=1274662 RepID=A0AAV1I7P2_9CHLO|nr:hypothetical protein CVIRNUC_006101 [Coccomyxa viridis]